MRDRAEAAEAIGESAGVHATPGRMLRPHRQRARASIHRTAIVEQGARLGEGCRIEAGAVVGPEVELGDRVRVGTYAVLTGRLTVGADTRIWPFAVVGEEPQDLSYGGEPSSVRVGQRCQIREYVTIHRGTAGNETVVEDDVMLMANSHVAHDCFVGDHAILANGALLAGHVRFGPRAFLSGNAVVHQFARVGRLAMVAGVAAVHRDVPPFALVARPGRLHGTNKVGLQRAGYSAHDRAELTDLYRLMRGASPAIVKSLPELRERARTEAGRELVAFLEADSRRGYLYF